VVFDWRNTAKDLMQVLPGSQIRDLHAKLLEKFYRKYRNMPNSTYVTETVRQIRKHAYELGVTIPHVSTWVDKDVDKFFLLAVDGSTKLKQWMKLSILEGLFCTFKRLKSQAIVDKITLEITLKYAPHLTVLTPMQRVVLTEMQSLNELTVETTKRAVELFEEFDKAA
jgi:hypothetical protein